MVTKFLLMCAFGAIVFLWIQLNSFRKRQQEVKETLLEDVRQIAREEARKAVNESERKRVGEKKIKVEKKPEGDKVMELDYAGSISTLWNYGSETAWNNALEHYYALLTPEQKVLEKYIEGLNVEEIKNLPVEEFYSFLHDKYFVWKYTQKNRLATTRMALEKYEDENRLFELGGIQKNLFSMSHNNVEECLQVVTKIRGLGAAGASGLLAILFPSDFGTVDQFVVKSLQKIENINYKSEMLKIRPEAITNKDGALLIKLLREKAVELNRKFQTDFWTPRKIDMVLWSVEREK